MKDEKKAEKNAWIVRVWPRSFTGDNTMDREEASYLEGLLNEFTGKGYVIERIDHERSFIVGKLAPTRSLLQSLLSSLPSASNPASEESPPSEGARQAADITMQGDHTVDVINAIHQCESYLLKDMPMSLAEKGSYQAIEQIFKDAGPIQAAKTLSDLPVILDGHRRMYHGGDVSPDCMSEKALLIFQQQLQNYLKTRQLD